MSLHSETVNPQLVDPSGRAELASEFFSLKIPLIGSDTRTNHQVVGTKETYSNDPFRVLNALKMREEPVKFLFVGITGDLFPRFFGNAVETLAEALPGIQNHFEIIPVGRKPQEAGDAIVADLRERFPNAPLSSYIPSSDCLKQIESGDLQIDGTFLATPPNQHLKGSRLYTELSNAPVFCEKPLCLPGQTNDFTKLLAERKNQILPIDCFTNTIPLYWLMNTEQGLELLGNFGNAAVINGTVTENQAVEINRLGGNLGLLRESVAGGGIGLDCGVHSYAMAKAFLGSSEIDLKNPRTICTASTYLDSEYLRRNTDPDFQDINMFRETAGLVQLIGKEAVINAQGMKGAAKTAYCLDLISHSGERIVISLGTDIKYPYLAYAKQDGSVKIHTFEKGYRPDVGYTGTLYSMLSFMCHKDGTNIFPKLPTMIDATMGGVEIFGQMNGISSSDFEKYVLGNNPNSCIPTPDEIDHLVPLK